MSEAQKFQVKWVVDAIDLRFKVYLLEMAQNLEVKLENLMALEQVVYALLDGLGIPEEEKPYYMAYAKRREVILLKFEGGLRTLETTLLKQEYIIRGWDENVLNAIDGVIDDLAQSKRGVVALPSPAWAYTDMACIWFYDPSGSMGGNYTNYSPVYILDPSLNQGGNYVNRT